MKWTVTMPLTLLVACAGEPTTDTGTATSNGMGGAVVSSAIAAGAGGASGAGGATDRDASPDDATMTSICDVPTPDCPAAGAVCMNGAGTCRAICGAPLECCVGTWDGAACLPSTDAGAWLTIGEPVCATWANARPFRGELKIKSWYASGACPAGMGVNLCNGTEGDIVPDNCTWFDGQPDGINTGCCPSGDTLPLMCATSADCPGSQDECYEPWCNTQLHQCMLTPAFKKGASCADGAGICMQLGEQRSEITGHWIGEKGWPYGCSVPQFPD